MSRKSNKAKKIKSKQEFLEDKDKQRSELSAHADDGDVEALVRVLSDQTAPSMTFPETLKDIARRARRGDDIDERLVFMVRDYRLFRNFAIALTVIAFGMILVSMFLYRGGIIGEEQQNFIIIMANFVMIAMLIIVFVRVSPTRKDIMDFMDAQAAAAQAVFDARRRGVEPRASEANVDLDEFFLTRGRRKRSERIPPTEEYRRIRAVWWVLVVVACLLMGAAMVSWRLNGGDITVSIVFLVASYVLLFVGMYIERAKMKPLRDAYREKAEAKRRKQARRS